MKKGIKEKILIIIFSFSIIGICCFNLNKLYGPMIVPDEIGYWATGYYFNGIDWSAIMGTSPYYGWGYGLILAVVLKITSNPVSAFRIAILVNGFLLVLSFIVLIKISDLLFGGMNRKTRIGVAFCVTLYAGNIYYAQTTYCETLLLLTFLIACYLLINIVSNPKKLYLCLLSIDSAVLLAIHLRSFVVIGVIGLIMFFLCFIKKIDIKKLILWFILTGILLIVVMEIKECITGGLYKNSVVFKDNDITGQLSKAELLLSWEGIKQFAGSVIGKLMYMGTASFLFFYTSIYIMSKKIIRQWMKHEVINIKEYIFILFILGVTIGEIFVSAYSLITFGRLDHIVYGRYTDFLMSLILLYGICVIRKGESKENIIISVIIHALMVLLTYRFIVNKDYLSKPSFYAIPGIAGMWVNVEIENIYKVSIYVGMVSIIIYLIICVLVKLNKIYAMLAFMTISWIFVALNASNQSLYYEQQEYERDFNEFANGIDNIVDKNEVYYVINDTEYVSWLKFKLKFFLPETNIIACESYEYEKVPEGSYLIIYEKENYYEEITETFENPIYCSEYFSLRRKEMK